MVAAAAAAGGRPGSDALLRLLCRGGPRRPRRLLPQPAAAETAAAGEEAEAATAARSLGALAWEHTDVAHTEAEDGAFGVAAAPRKASRSRPGRRRRGAGPGAEPREDGRPSSAHAAP